MQPSGKVLARWISSNIKGIGEVIAKRLVRLPKLAELIEKRERSSLLAVAGMSEARLDRLLEEWPDESLYDTITWLEEQHLPLGLGEKLSALFGAEAIEKIKEHPFLLMAMGASFEKTMEIAKELGLSRRKFVFE